MTSRFDVDADGTMLRGGRWGDRGPTVVLLHAGVCDRRGFEELAVRLARAGMRVIAYDRRGFGETPLAVGASSDLADLEAVLDACGEDAVWLCGSSKGGGLALDAALAFPDRLAGLVLLAPAVDGAPSPSLEDLDPATAAIAVRLEEATRAGDPAEVNRLELLLWLDGPSGPEGRVGGRARDLAREMNAAILANGVDEDAGGSAGDVWGALERVSTPTWIAWGELDVPFLVDRCRLLAERLPVVRQAVSIPGTAHLPYLEQPDAVARLVAGAVTGA